MKAAISIPDPLFEATETLARRLGKSRSQQKVRLNDHHRVLEPRLRAGRRGKVGPSDLTALHLPCDLAQGFDLEGLEPPIQFQRVRVGGDDFR